MKLAVIGNSHIGCLKRGWELIVGEHPSVEIVFFGSRGLSLQNLAVKEGRIAPTTDDVRDALMFTSGGRPDIALEGFDAVLIYGLDAAPFFLDGGVFYSTQALRRAMEGMTKGRIYFKILEMIRELSPLTVYVGHNPLKAAALRKSMDQSVEAYERGLDRMNEVVFAPRSARMVPQPRATIVNGDATHVKYNKGSRRLAIGDGLDDALHRDDDIKHMNDAFGQLWLKNFLAEAVG